MKYVYKKYKACGCVCSPIRYLSLLQLRVGGLQDQLLVLLQLLGQLIYLGQLLAQLLVADAKVGRLRTHVRLPLVQALHLLLQGAVGLLQVLYLRAPPSGPEEDMDIYIKLFARCTYVCRNRVPKSHPSTSEPWVVFLTCEWAESSLILIPFDICSGFHI